MRSEDRVATAARERGLHIEIHTFPEGTRTAADAAAAVGCDIAQIVKSLVFVVDDEVVVALVGGGDRLDERKLAAVAGGSAVRRAAATEVRVATGYAVGGVPPFGYPTELRCFIDDALLGHDVVWAAAGTPNHDFAISPTELVSVARATVAELRA